SAEARAGAVEALLTASQALVGLAARSLAGLNEDVTLPQYRTMVVLASRGPQRVADIAAELGVAPSTATRMCDRLVRKGWARRSRSTRDRRVVRLALTPAGRDLIEQVMERRREYLRVMVSDVPQLSTPAVVQALTCLASAADDPSRGRRWLSGDADGVGSVGAADGAGHSPAGKL
ncbi:MAG TPA: MarR family transcriptional regulator, partial [Micromonosporaceae bacterium]